MTITELLDDIKKGNMCYVIDSNKIKGLTFCDGIITEYDIPQKKNLPVFIKAVIDGDNKYHFRIMYTDTDISMQYSFGDDCKLLFNDIDISTIPIGKTLDDISFSDHMMIKNNPLNFNLKNAKTFDHRDPLIMAYISIYNDNEIVLNDTIESMKKSGIKEINRSLGSNKKLSK